MSTVEYLNITESHLKSFVNHIKYVLFDRQHASIGEMKMRMLSYT